VGNTVAFSKTIDDEITVIFLSFPFFQAAMAPSKDAAMMRSFSAIRSYANLWK